MRGAVEIDLNTSHVKVNRFTKINALDLSSNLNTSHVKVNQVQLF